MDKIKAIFLDFDWTLYDHNKDDYNYDAIKALQEVNKKGVKLFINSARAYYSLKHLNIFDMLHFDGYGIINGLYCLTNDKLLYAYYINDEIVKDLISICEENKFSYLITTIKETYIKDFKDDITKVFYDCIKEPYPLDIKEYNGTDRIVAFQVYITSENDDKFAKYKGKLNMARWAMQALEINALKPSKKDPVRYLLREYGIAPEQAIAIGDDINDIGMFEEVKYSICMGNGHPDAKAKAYMVTDNIEENGIVNALKKLELI